MTRKCPACGHRGAVLDTRETETTVRRQRECISCRARWTTWETTANPDTALATVRETMTRIKTAARLAEKAIEDMQRPPLDRQPQPNGRTARGR